MPLSSGQFSALYSDYFGVRSVANKNIESGSDQQIISLVQEMENKFNYSVSSHHFKLSFTKFSLPISGCNYKPAEPSNVAI